MFIIIRTVVQIFDCRSLQTEILCAVNSHAQAETDGDYCSKSCEEMKTSLVPNPFCLHEEDLRGTRLVSD